MDGFQLLENGRAEEAKPYFLKAIALDSTNLKYYLNLGAACNQTKDWSLALSTYTKAIAALPREAELYYYRGEVYNKQQQFAKAKADFSEAIRLGKVSDPNAMLYLYYFNRGVASLKLQHYPEAITDFTETISLDKAHHGAYTNRGMARFNSKDKAGACQDWNQAYALGYDAIKKQLAEYCR